MNPFRCADCTLGELRVFFLTEFGSQSAESRYIKKCAYALQFLLAARRSRWLATSLPFGYPSKKNLWKVSLYSRQLRIQCRLTPFDVHGTHLEVRRIRAIVSLPLWKFYFPLGGGPSLGSPARLVAIALVQSALHRCPFICIVNFNFNPLRVAVLATKVGQRVCARAQERKKVLVRVCVVTD